MQERYFSDHWFDLYIQTEDWTFGDEGDQQKAIDTLSKLLNESLDQKDLLMLWHAIRCEHEEHELIAQVQGMINDALHQVFREWESAPSDGHGMYLIFYDK